MFSTDPQTTARLTPLARIIREETDDGRMIVQFLLDMMRDRSGETRDCHRMAAARQLAKFGLEEAHAFIQAASEPAKSRTKSTTPANPTNSGQNNELADLIKNETSGGRDTVRFLVNVMNGNLEEFKPHHRIAAAKELLRRGFDDISEQPEDGNNEQADEELLEEPARPQNLSVGADFKPARGLAHDGDADRPRAPLEHRDESPAPASSTGYQDPTDPSAEQSHPGDPAPNQPPESPDTGGPRPRRVRRARRPRWIRQNRTPVRLPEPNGDEQHQPREPASPPAAVDRGRDPPPP